MALLAIITVIAGSNRRLADANRTIRGNSEQIAAQNNELERRNQDLVQARGEAEQERDQAREVTAFLVLTFHKPHPEMDGRDVKVAQVLGDAARALEARKGITPLTRAAILSAIGDTYNGLGLAAEAASIYQTAPGTPPPGVPTIPIRSPPSLPSPRHTGSPASILAIRVSEQVLQARRAGLGDSHPLTLEAMNNLAVHYEDSGQLDRAIELFQQTLKAQRASLGEDHLDTVLTMHNLADTYFLAGQPEQAIPVFEKAVAKFGAIKGPKDPVTLEMTNNLARAYLATGRFDRALALNQQVLEARLARLGPDHPLTLTSTNNVATTYLQQGHPDRAIPLLEQALARATVEAGPAPSFGLHDDEQPGQCLQRRRSTRAFHPAVRAGPGGATGPAGRRPSRDGDLAPESGPRRTRPSGDPPTPSGSSARSSRSSVGANRATIATTPTRCRCSAAA